VSSNLVFRLLLDRLFRLGGRERLEVEQMLLALAIDNPFTPSAVDPSLQRVEFIDRSLVRFPQFLIRSGRFIEHVF
jgi:hypothetical protein